MSTMSSASKQLEEDYNKRIDADVDKFVESYGRIVAASKLGNKDLSQTTHDAHIVSTMTSNLAKASEGLLTLTTELKASYLLNDTKALNETIQSRRKVLDKTMNVNKEVLGKLQSEIGELKRELQRAVWEFQRD